MAQNTEVRWGTYSVNPNWPVTEFSGIRWQWQVDQQSGQQMWFAINWLQTEGPLATQAAQPVASGTAIAEASGHQGEASVIASAVASVTAIIVIVIAIIVRQR